MLLAIASIVKASKARQSHKKPTPPTTLYDTSVGAGREIPVQPASGSRPESEMAKDKASIGESVCALVPFAVPESGTSSVDTIGDDFRRAVDEGDFTWLRRNCDSFLKREDLFDHVITKGVAVIANFISDVYYAKERVLAALFVNGTQKTIDGVFDKIICKDAELENLIQYRRELTTSHEKLVSILDKIVRWDYQKRAVRCIVGELLRIGDHGRVISLVNALGKKASNGESLQDVAIQVAFFEGARKGTQSIVELYCNHPAITSKEYAGGLHLSWNTGKPSQVFQFLFGQADVDDLNAAKKQCTRHRDERFREAINKVLEAAPPVGSRVISIEQAQAAVEILNEITGLQDLGPSNILASYLLDEERTKEMMKPKILREGTGKGIGRETEEQA